MAKRDEHMKPNRTASVKDPTRKIGPGIDSQVVEGEAVVSTKLAEELQTPPMSDAVAANRKAILESPSYKLAELDIDFLKRKENRPLRMQLEMLKTETMPVSYTHLTLPTNREV